MPVLSKTFFRVIFTLIGGLILLLAFGGTIFKAPLFKRMVLEADQKKAEGYSIRQEPLTTLIGEKAQVFSDLRPAGKIIIGNNVYDAISQGELIQKGEEVVVLREEGYSLIVKKA